MFFKLTIAAVIVIVTIVGLVQFQRYLRGEDIGLFSGSRKRREPKSKSNELEAFIAAYRRDKSVVAEAAKPVPPFPASAGSAADARPAPLEVKVPGSFLQGPAKVLYLVLKAALPDHHIFVYTRLTDVIKPIGKPLTPQGRAQFAQSRMDFVVCNKDLAVVAMLDITDGTRADDPIKQHLQPQLSTAGIRYLRVAPTAIPKPAEVRALILGG
jgi:hypothetical protein